MIDNELVQSISFYCNFRAAHFCMFFFLPSLFSYLLWDRCETFHAMGSNLLIQILKWEMLDIFISHLNSIPNIIFYKCGLIEPLFRYIRTYMERWRYCKVILTEFMLIFSTFIELLINVWGSSLRFITFCYDTINVGHLFLSLVRGFSIVSDG